ncbi:Multidrug resistance protein MdtA precursor [Posidoniimonas polymericola]|uniref:Multidrug resistance protein MdtA n=1 Tax=Posidoniimonas polymericola TaxID=2528002 RepID=A0A5C5XWB5_9BACT|nr:efflux RND transporter periplasmic adaptor subunit [Posidoniimonas polymericola]TWT66831.1 Multidrug resistance protein MdtA precursor [Posidoniimonas polymericola]
MSPKFLVLTSLGWGLLVGTPATAQPGGGASPAVAARAVLREVTDSQSFVGTVTPVKRAVVGSAVAGRVIECPFEEGDRVEAFQKLAQLLTETISLEIAAAEGEFELRTQQLAELENGSRPEEIQQAQARMQAAEARRDFLAARRDRLQAIYERRGAAISEDELQEARANAAEAEQIYLEASAAHDLAVAGPRQEVISQARAQVQIQQAVVEKLKDQRKKYTVSSKFDGYVVSKQTEVGAWLNQGDPVAEVVSVDSVDVDVQVGEQSLPFISPGKQVQAVFPALPKRVFEGTVLAAVPQGNLRTRTFPVKVRIKNEITDAGPVLKPGMYARVTLPTGGAVQAVMAPKDGVIHGGVTPMLYAIDGATPVGQAAAVRPVPVELGVAEGGLIQVTGQLKQGDLVIVQGNERLRPGQEVTITKIIGEGGVSARR